MSSCYKSITGLTLQSSNPDFMNQFYSATKVDFDDLLKLIIAFELDKHVAYDKEDKIDQAKMLKENKKNLKAFLNDKTYNYIVCKRGNALIAYIFLSYADIYEGEGYINEVYVLPEQRKKGIAKKLLAKGIAWLQENNCKTIDITVNRKNKPALALYTKYGFERFKDSYISMRKKFQTMD
jgi:ribosomal protein S18 acetylase RimI-like enzyme